MGIGDSALKTSIFFGVSYVMQLDDIGWTKENIIFEGKDGLW